jgi:hypothetical protein
MTLSKELTSAPEQEQQLSFLQQVQVLWSSQQVQEP